MIDITNALGRIKDKYDDTARREKAEYVMYFTFIRYQGDLSKMENYNLDRITSADVEYLSCAAQLPIMYDSWTKSIDDFYKEHQKDYDRKTLTDALKEALNEQCSLIDVETLKGPFLEKFVNDKANYDLTKAITKKLKDDYSKDIDALESEVRESLRKIVADLSLQQSNVIIVSNVADTISAILDKKLNEMRRNVVDKEDFAVQADLIKNIVSRKEVMKRLRESIDDYKEQKALSEEMSQLTQTEEDVLRKKASDEFELHIAKINDYLVEHSCANIDPIELANEFYDNIPQNQRARYFDNAIYATAECIPTGVVDTALQRCISKYNDCEIMKEVITAYGKHDPAYRNMPYEELEAQLAQLIPASSPVLESQTYRAYRAVMLRMKDDVANEAITENYIKEHPEVMAKVMKNSAYPNEINANTASYADKSYGGFRFGRRKPMSPDDYRHNLGVPNSYNFHSANMDYMSRYPDYGRQVNSCYNSYYDGYRQQNSIFPFPLKWLAAAANVVLILLIMLLDKVVGKSHNLMTIGLLIAAIGCCMWPKPGQTKPGNTHLRCVLIGYGVFLASLVISMF